MAVNVPVPGDVKLSVKPMQQLLSEEDRVLLESVIARLPIIEDILHRAAASGIDVDAHANRHNMHEVVSKSIHANWFGKELPAIQE